MPKLNEYIGSIVAGITDARMMSDIQSVRVAQEYARHPWLQHFAVPRMRIEDVELTIPVALDSLSERSVTSFEPVDNETFHTAAISLVTRAFGISTPAEDQAKLLREEVSRLAKQLDMELGIASSLDPVKTFTRSLSSFVIERSKEFGIEKLTTRRGFNLEKIHDEISSTLSKEIKVVSETKAIDALNVVVEADKLREKKPESLLIIKMKISEEGMEWHKIETGGKVESRLLPE